jgi:hypothetical protein
MCSYEHFPPVDHFKGDSGPAGRTRSVKAKPVARRERFAATPLVLSEMANVPIPTPLENIRRGRRDPGTCFDKILPDSERRDQEFVLLGTPLPGRDHQGRMQKRLSARPSGTLESVGSSRGSDSELSHVRTIQKDDF